ncbi:fam-c protein [Plasmodium yoelii]|uniref:Fam-c protein n=3 Tax=Plasmodium yoelii TaxID=5861 RepID=A0AAE9WMU8_PLAYO|nr:fam-c protein [Plasmodium yoelii]WBY56973.1 fam-c protein [Plasmodium yoelii yoelii]CDU17767.1 fam-c protein [Plasmodium yoelii]VTZ77814.1 fam-c protein [Plasmodium yoelii]|eukprot:XP_022812074.1 fam-c protein [Plasmodium yoelii]
MNIKIYSLVTVFSYIISIVTIHCFKNNADLNKYVKKNKKVDDEYKINNIDINNNEKFRYRNLSECTVENNYILGSTKIQESSDDKKSKGFNFFKCFNIFKRDKKNQSSDNNECLPEEVLEWNDFLHSLFEGDQEGLMSILHIKEKLEKSHSNNNESIPRIKLRYGIVLGDSIPKNKEKFENKSSNNNESLSMITSVMKVADRCYYLKNPEHLKLLLDSKQL